MPVLLTGPGRGHVEGSLDRLESGSCQLPDEHTQNLPGMNAGQLPAHNASEPEIASAAGNGQQADAASRSTLLRSDIHALESSVGAEQDVLAQMAHESQWGGAAAHASDPDVDVEKGDSFQDCASRPVDFLGGFSLNNSFDPKMDV